MGARGSKTDQQVSNRIVTDVRIVVVGNHVGKTSLLISYTEGKFPTEYVPSVFDVAENYEAEFVVKGNKGKVTLWDIPKRVGNTRIRTLSYPGTSVFLYCFAIDDPSSFADIPDWAKETQNKCPTAISFLVGLKSDLREEGQEQQQESEKFITEEEGFEMANKIHAIKYLECSAITRKGLKNVFDEALLSSIDPDYVPLPAGAINIKSAKK